MGPGDHLREVLEQLGLYPNTCECKERMRQMNEWGIAGCQEHKNEILAWLRIEQGRRGWVEQGRAAFLAIKTGLFTKLSPMDPANGLFEEAMRRARLDVLNGN